MTYPMNVMSSASAKGSKKKDFATLYAENTERQLIVNREKLQLDREIRNEEISIRREQLDYERTLNEQKLDKEKLQLRQEVMLRLIEK
jgi:hypothetical protein